MKANSNIAKLFRKAAEYYSYHMDTGDLGNIIAENCNTDENIILLAGLSQDVFYKLLRAALIDAMPTTFIKAYECVQSYAWDARLNTNVAENKAALLKSFTKEQKKLFKEIYG